MCKPNESKCGYFNRLYQDSKVFYGPQDIYSWSYLVTLYEVPIRRHMGWRADGQAGNSDSISMVQSWGVISSLGNLSFVLKAFRWLEEVHPKYQGWTSLLKINWLQMLATSRKYLHISCQHFDCLINSQDCSLSHLTQKTQHHGVQEWFKHFHVKFPSREAY